MDINAAVGSEAGLSDERLLAVVDRPAGAFGPAGETGPPETSPPETDAEERGDGLFPAAWRAALAYADAMTTGDVDDACFAAVAAHFDADQLVELTETIAWENASARFNRALRIDSQRLWRGPTSTGAPT